MNRLIWHLLFFSLMAVQSTFADVRMPNVFGSHMVLQRRKPVPVWGWADAGEKVTVTLNKQIKTVKAGKDGKWRITLDAMEAGGPYQMLVQGKKNTLTFDDVLAGEVWICSGQSNMEWPLSAAANAKTEIPTANFPNIRQLLVKKDLSLTPKDNIDGSWSVCTPETAPQFTAVGYFFAKQLQKELNVPIGLINTSWGGTHSETWTSREAMNQNDELKLVAAKLPATDEEVLKSGAARTQALMKEQQGGLPTAAEEQAWGGANLDDTNWKSMNMPGDWEWSGLPTLDGVVWFRQEIMIPEGSNLQKMTLNIESIADSDSTFINGQMVGSIKGGRPRAYAVPDGLLKPGRNVIAIRVADNGGSGGIMGRPEQFKLAGDGLSIPLAGKWKYRVASVFESSYKPGPNTYATQLFNAMLNPLIPYAIEGAIWYQGESNAGRAYQYRKTFPLMIQDWRQHWGYDFPFLFVQLASFNASNGDSRHGSGWAELREAQTMTLQLPNTGMAVTSDIGERTDIHPKNKLDVGNRLAAEAMRVAYHQPGEEGSDVSRGPMLDKMTVEGNKAVLTFRNGGSGLLVKDKYGYLKGFEIAGADKKFYYAKAAIQGNSIVVQADSVTIPVAVRYGWADDNGDVNLYNKENFPAVPFRTDTWKGITEAAKFEEH
ncbi:sialate O-acetylesterase [Spirosoma pollinicola]|uniref:Sialate O-acetylesterase n=1 Tax=Spirosoma pollinicola TaxID=2057025 RepID=A0A2K8Z758_9BACT|nr:sialate O-acetylesterase [Spirosoma pollinicola]AUD05690.1 sialate O-acetylesterase [Spirosoma pollinicola]